MPVDMKAMIANTYLQLAKQEEIDKITVKRLIEACHISRQTFYYHFQDLIDVIAWIAQKNGDLLVEKCLKMDRIQEACELFVHQAKNQYPMIEKLLNSQKRDYVEQLMVQSVRNALVEIARNRGVKHPVMLNDLDFVLDFYAYGIVGLLLKYCPNPQMKESVLAEKLHRLLSGEVFGFSE